MKIQESREGVVGKVAARPQSGIRAAPCTPSELRELRRDIRWAAAYAEMDRQAWGDFAAALRRMARKMRRAMGGRRWPRRAQARGDIILTEERFDC